MTDPERCETCPWPNPRRGSTEMLAHAYQLHGLLRDERERADRLAAALGEIAEVLGDLARRSPELQLNEKVEARAALKESGP